MSLRVIFLDFDGVLHATSGSAEEMRQFVWLPILKGLIEGRDDIRVVIHASHRRNSPEDFLRERLGFDKDLCLGVTSPRLARWPSIQGWIKDRQWIESYRILDDQAGEFPEPAPAELILCDGRRGLSDEKVQVALKEWIHG